jgi:hypothetical protein
MPLDSQDKVGVGVVWVLSALDRLDHGILGAAGDHTEPVTGDPDGLVVAGVDRKP